MEISLLEFGSSLFKSLCSKLYENPMNKENQNTVLLSFLPNANAQWPSLINTNFSSNEKCLSRFLLT